MASFWEPEEFVGGIWHRLVGDTSSYPRHPQAAVRLEEVRIRLGVLFRALGGPGAVRLAGGAAEASGHRLGLIQRLGLGTEKLERARYDGVTLQLPDRIDLFPDRADNAALYEWLAAFFVHAEAPPVSPSDPLQADLARLRAAHKAVERATAEWPGLRALHERLCRALRDIDPGAQLSGQEAAVEALVVKLVGGDTEVDPELLTVITDAAAPLDRFRANSGYRPFLPVPLWGEVTEPAAGTAPAEGDEEGGGGAEGDGKRRKASRRDSDQTQRDDPLMLNRFEKILGLAEMVNLNRKTEDDDEESARRRPRTWMRSPSGSTSARHRPG